MIPVTAAPTASTTPVPSCPNTIGISSAGQAAWLLRSVWHTPAAVIRTNTSRGRGTSRSTSRTVNGPPGVSVTAARIRMGPHSRRGRDCWRTTPTGAPDHPHARAAVSDAGPVIRPYPLRAILVARCDLGPRTAVGPAVPNRGNVAANGPSL
ncbi:protein of unknown function [Streptomyces murinus]